MSRVETSNLKLGAWDESDNPGAGSKTVASSNTGLNGNWLILDAAVGVGHTAAGAHKDDIIDGPNLKTTVADGVAVQLTGSPLKLNLKDGGIATAKIADDAVTAAKLADGCIDAAAKLAADVVITAKILDANVTHAKLATDSVDATNITHDNTRTIAVFQCAILTAAGTDYAKWCEIQLDASHGIPMPLAGSIVKVMVIQADGTVTTATAAYGSKPFSAGQRITVYWYDGDGKVLATIIGTGTSLDTADNSVAGSNPMAVVICVEFDD